jgi:capsular polysaccharide biosynthesis protein
MDVRPTPARPDEPYDVPEQPGRSRLGPLRNGRRDPFLVVAVLLTAVVGIAVGVIASSLTSSRAGTYSSTSKLLINQPQALSLSDTDGVVLKLSRLRLKYVGLVGTPVIDNPVAAQLHRSPAQLGGLLDAIAPTQNLNINIIGISANPHNAQQLAQAAAQQLAAYATREQIADRIPANQRFVLTIIAPASSPTRAAGSSTRALFVGCGAGVLAAAAVAGGLFLQRRRR